MNCQPNQLMHYFCLGNPTKLDTYIYHKFAWFHSLKMGNGRVYLHFFVGSTFQGLGEMLSTAAIMSGVRV